MSWKRFLHRKRSDAELQNEIEIFLSEETADNVARGMSPEEARRQARLKFGNTQKVRESLWMQNTPQRLTTFARDAKYAFRTSAQRDQLLQLVLMDGLRPALFGLGLGLVMSFAATRIFESMLFGTKPLDPVVLAGVIATLLAVAVLACLAPAWRASRINPTQALRTE